jgi:nicotinamidase-related amidase
MKSALIVVDVQQSFTRRPYWSEQDVPAFIARLQQLVNRSRAAGVPVLQVFHVDESEGPQGAFSQHSGLVSTLPQLDITPQEVFRKSVHSAMFGSDAQGRSLDYWLRTHGIERVIVTGIRTEQCCETTTRHASDLGYRVSYALDATLTFPMTADSGRTYSAADIKDRTALVLAGRFAEVTAAEAIVL